MYLIIANIITFCILSLLTTTASSAPLSYDQEQQIMSMEKIGITFTQTGSNIDIIIDEQKTLNALPKLISKGILSMLDAKVVNTAPLSISIIIVGISSTLNILNSAFQNNNNLNTVHVNGYVIPLGATNKQPCYSFDYDRNKFMMLNLEILKTRDFVANTPGFTFSNWCSTNLTNEADQLKSN